MHFRLGAIMGLNLSAEFSMQGQFGVGGSAPGAPGVSGVDHLYDDGFVRVDRFGNTGGYTSYWGYLDASQYDANTGQLTMHAARSFDYGGSTIEADDEPYLGVDLAYGVALKRWGKLRLGVELGLSWLPVKIEDTRALDVAFVRTVHQFDTAGILMPDAPYNGSSNGLGPTIRDVATALPDDTGAGQITGSRELDVNVFNVRLGPTLEWRFHPRWSVLGGLGVALGFGTGQYDFDETLTYADGGTSRNQGSMDSTEVAFGGYVNALVLYRTNERAEVFLGAQYLYLGDMTFGDSGRSAELKLGSGIYFTAGINWFF